MTTKKQIDHASNLAMFLLERSGSVLGQWKGRLSAAEQRQVFGRFVGKGTLIVDGATERLVHRIKVCFGHDYEDTVNLAWRDL
jgi:hypothetical protein